MVTDDQLSLKFGYTVDPNRRLRAVLILKMENGVGAAKMDLRSRDDSDGLSIRRPFAEV